MRNFIVFLMIIFGLSYTDSPANFRLTYPNGGEKFIVGSDTLITWEGILPTDTVKLEYSIDNGVNWTLISDKATGLKHVWKNIPLPVSDECLVKIKPVTKGDSSRFEPAIEWQKTYGGSETEWLYCVKQTRDGGYIVVGRSNSNDGDVTKNHGVIDIWVVKLNNEGIIEWEKTYGGSLCEWPTYIQQTIDGGFIVSGITDSKDGDVSDNKYWGVSWIFKLDAIGNLEWEKTHWDDSWEARSIQQTRDSGYIVIVESQSKEREESIVKLDSKGNILWEKIHKTKPLSNINSIRQTSDNGFVFAGYSYMVEKRYNAWIGKLDGLGNLEWDKTYGGVEDTIVAAEIEQTSDGGYVTVGNACSLKSDSTAIKGLSDYWVLKVDPLGNVEWQKTYGGSGNDNAQSIKQTADGGYIVDGITGSNDFDVHNFKGLRDGWLVKLDKFGNLQWEKTVGGNGDEWTLSVDNTIDGGYITAGWSISTDIPGCNLRGYSDNRVPDAYIVKLGPYLQSYTSGLFSIITPQAFSNDIDMKKSYVGTPKDSIVTNFVFNAAKNEFQVDSIYFRGADAGAFSIQSAFPKYSLEPKEGKDTKFRFTPTRVGIHLAEIVIIAQTDTLIQKIQGEGYKDDPKIESAYEPFDDLICLPKTNYRIPITNNGGKPLIITELNISGINADEFSVVETLPKTVDPKKTAYISVYFTPKSVGTKTAVFEIVSNAMPDTIFKIPLTATKELVNLAFVEDTIDLGYLCPDEEKVMAFNIQNIGTLASSATLSSNPRIKLAKEKLYLSVNESVGITFKYKGSSVEGDISEIIVLTDTICGVPKIINIIGKVLIPKIEAKDVSINTMVNVAKQAAITIHNTGERDVTITNPPVLFPSLTWVGNQFPATIPAKDSTEFLIEFLPFDIQGFSLMITFFADQCDIKQNVNIQLLADMPPPKLIVSIKNDSAYAGQVRRLKLMMSNIAPEEIAAYAPSFSAKIRFQKTILTPLKKAERNIVNDSMYMNVKGTFAATYELSQMLVTAGLGSVEETSLDIVEFNLTDEAGNKIDSDLEIEKQPGLFKLLGICREGGTRLINPTGKAEILQIIPNPASDDIEIKVNLIEDGVSTLSVYNVNGVKLREFSLNDGTGLKTMYLNINDFANGLYFIQLLTPTVVNYQKLMIVK